MAGQEQKLLGALVLAVENLRYPDVLYPALRDRPTACRLRHEARALEAIGGALLETFSDFLGPEWTPEVKSAWVDAYAAIASLMLEGATSPRS